MKSMESWIAYAESGNTFKLRNELIERVGEIFPDKATIGSEAQASS